MSHRIRHKGATAVGYKTEDKLIACAMTVAETEYAAIIGAVAVLPEYQRQGIGTSVVKVYCMVVWKNIRNIFMCIVIQNKMSNFTVQWDLHTAVYGRN